MPFDLGRAIAACGGSRRGLHTAQGLLDACNTRRVALAVVSDSNGRHNGFGWNGAVFEGFAGVAPVFGTGFYTSMWGRTLTQSDGGGSINHWPAYSGAGAAGGSRTWIQATGGTTAGTTITGLSGISGVYAPRDGDRASVWITSSGVFVGEVDVVASTTTGTTLGLATSLGSGTGVYAFIYPKAGGTPFVSGPSATYVNSFNFKGEFNGGGYFLASGSASMFNMGTLILHKWGRLPVNGRLVGATPIVSEAGGRVTTIFQEATSTYGSGLTIGSSTQYNASGSAATFQVARCTTAAGNRNSLGGGTPRECVVFSNAAGTNIGPIGLLGDHVCNLDLARGISVSPFLMRGGATSYDIAHNVGFMSDAAVENWIRCVTSQFDVASGGDATRRLAIIINLGFNDHGSTTLDYESGSNPTYSAAGYVANIRYFVDRLEARYNAVHGAGSASSEITWIFMPSHPVSNTRTAPATTASTMAEKQYLTMTYVQALAAYAATKPSAVVVDLYELFRPTAYEQIPQSHGVNPVSDADIIHLAGGGYLRCMSEWLRAVVASQPRYTGITRGR